MKTATLIFALFGACALSACTESKRAQNSAKWNDRPADLTCWTYGTEIYTGRSTGKVEYDDGGRISFVDAATNRYITIDGDCRVLYQAKAVGAHTPASDERAQN